MTLAVFLTSHPTGAFDRFYKLTSILIVIFIPFLLYLYAPPVSDWWHSFHKVGGTWLKPYSGGFHFAYPPWVAGILAPFHFVEPQLSRALWAFLTALSCSFSIKSLKGDSFSLLLLVSSVPFISLVGNGQSDGIAILGLGLIIFHKFLPQLAGSILLLGKPQSMIFVLPVLLVKSNHRLKLIVGGVIFGLFTFLIWGWWIPDMYEMAFANLPNVSWNWSFWPYGIPLGLFMLCHALKTKSLEIGALAAFFLVPYLAWYSFSGFLLIIYAKAPRWVAIVLYLFINFLSFRIYI